MASAASMPMIIQPHPFRMEHINALAPAGSTIAQAVAATGLPPMMGAYIRVWVGDWEVPRDLWATARPKPDVPVFIRVFPHGGGGGGKNPLATVLSLAVMFVAPEIGFMAADAMGLGAVSGVFASTGVSLMWGQVLGAGFSLIGNMAIRSLVGTPTPAQEANNFNSGQATAPTYAITGTSNRVAPYANIPRVLGKRRLYPLMAGRPYTESQGNDRYVRLLLLAGYGPLSISDIRIGETPITAFAGVEVEINEGGPSGWGGNKPITLYTQAIREDQLSIVLTSVGSWQLRQTQESTTEISLDISFPQGLITYGTDGSRITRNVVVEVQYRLVGSVTWLTPIWSNTADPGADSAGILYATETTQSSCMRSGRWYTGGVGTYEVQVRRVTADGGDHDVDTTVWSALRSIQTQTPVRQPQVCTIAIRIKASEQLNGIPDSINCLAEAWHPVWNGSTWSWQKTSNPAWEALDLLRRRGADTIMADSRLDLAGYLAFASACDATPPNGPAPYWSYDAVLDGGSVWVAVKDVLAHGRATRTMKDGKHSVVMDATQTVPIQHISPRNSWNYAGTKKFIDLPHALHVKFTNAERGYVEDVCTVYADGYTEANATRFESVDYFGCTRSEQAWRIGRYLHAVGTLRPEDHTTYLDIESLRCTLGDMVRFSHDVILVGLGAGRLLGTTSGGGYTTALSIDSPVEMAVDKTYAIRCRRTDGTSVLMSVNTVFGEQATLTLTTPIVNALAPAAGDLFQFGESGLESMAAIVKRIERGPDLTAKLILVDAAPGVWTADSGSIPTFSSWITSGVSPRNQAPGKPVIVLRSDITAVIRLADGTLQDRIAVTMSLASAGAVPMASYDMRWRETGSAEWSAIQTVPDANATGWIAPVVMGSTYDVQVRAISVYGTPGEWGQADPHTVIGKSAPPADVASLTISGNILSWPAVDDTDLAGYRIKFQYGTNLEWGTASQMHTDLVTASPYTMLLVPPGQVTVMVRAVDVIGNESAASAYVITNMGNTPVANVVESNDFKASGWKGSLINGSLVGGNLQASQSDPFYKVDASNFYNADGALFYSANYDAMEWISPAWTPSLASAGSRMTVAFTLTGDAMAVQYRPTGPLPFYDPDMNSFYAADTSLFFDASPEWQGWPGSIVAENQRYKWRVITSSGPNIGLLSEFTVSVDVPDKNLKLNGIAVDPAGTRLTGAIGLFNTIQNIQLTLQGGSSAMALEIIDKSATLGPLIAAKNSAGTGVAATIDALLQGY